MVALERLFHDQDHGGFSLQGERNAVSSRHRRPRFSIVAVIGFIRSAVRGLSPACDVAQGFDSLAQTLGGARKREGIIRLGLFIFLFFCR